MIHVAVAVLQNSEQQVLVALRRPDSHQGGLWEFPGGKVEAEETVFAALQREIEEELGLTISAAFPFVKIQHDYVDKRVLLDVWRVTEFHGEASGREGQQIKWQLVAEMQPENFPVANRRIIKLLQLPAEMAITPALQNMSELSSYFHKVSNAGIKLVQLRQKHLSAASLRQWLVHAKQLSDDLGLRLVLNTSIDWLGELPPGVGLHLSATELGRMDRRPPTQLPLLGCSCHSAAELARAEAMALDYALLSPVAETTKYAPGAALGWRRFADLSAAVSLPVYALGGLAREDLASARQVGAAGIAGISMYL